MKYDKLIENIKRGAIFIYPTDTIYGIGCNAFNKKSVKKIKKIKGRDKNKPLSIIAPSKSWIIKNLKTNKKIKQLIKKYLPGKYTLLIPKKNKEDFSYISDNELLGVRIPKHKFTKFIKKANVPFITTSVNKSGQVFAKSIEDIPKQILNQVDFIIKGKVSGKPSTIIFPDGKILKR